MSQPVEIAGFATFKVMSRGARERRFIGTAFTISDSAVLTCRHVWEDAQASGVPVFDGGPRGDLTASSWHVADDPNLDVAYACFDRGTFSEWLPLTCADVAVDTAALTCIGYGSETGGLRSWRDHVSGALRAYGLVALQSTVHKGCSGGPVLDSQERAVAINIARHNDGAVKYVLPVRYFYGWLEQLGYRPSNSAASADAANGSLTSVPIGPLVQLTDVPLEVIDAFATACSTAETARLVIAAANRLSIEHNPEGMKPRQITLPVADQPYFDVPTHFWSSVFSKLGTRSRRSVAALLEAEGAPLPAVLDLESRSAWDRFRSFLRKY